MLNKNNIELMKLLINIMIQLYGQIHLENANVWAYEICFSDDKYNNVRSIS